MLNGRPTKQTQHVGDREVTRVMKINSDPSVESIKHQILNKCTCKIVNEVANIFK